MSDAGWYNQFKSLDSTWKKKRTEGHSYVKDMKI